MEDGWAWSEQMLADRTDGPPLALAALEHLSIPVTVLVAVRDDAGTIVDLRLAYTNPANDTLRRVDIERDHLLGRTMSELMPAFRESGLYERYVAVLETGVPYTEEALSFSGTVHDGDEQQQLEGTFELVVVRIGPDALMSSSRDVSEQHHARRSLSQMRDELESQARIDAEVREINDRILDNLVRVTRALDDDDVAAARQAAHTALEGAASLIADLRALPVRSG